MLVTECDISSFGFHKTVAENIRSSSDNPFTTLKFAKFLQYNSFREFNAKGNSISLLI